MSNIFRNNEIQLAWSLVPNKMVFLSASLVTALLQISVSIAVGFLTKSVFEPELDISVEGVTLSIVVIMASAVSQSFLSYLVSMDGWTGAIRIIKTRLGNFFAQYERDIQEDFSKTIINDYQRLSQGVIVPIMLMASGVVIASLLTTGIVYLLGLRFVLIGSSLLFILVVFPTLYLRRLISRNSSRITENDSKRFQTVQGVIRVRAESIVYSLRDKVERLVVEPSLNYGKSVGKGLFFSSMFKPMYETSGLIVLVFFILSLDQHNEGSLGNVGAVVFLIYRLIPALQQIFINLGRFNNNKGILFYLKENVPRHKSLCDITVDRIDLRGVSVGSNDTLLSLPDFSFNRGKINIIMGNSGAGKSTALGCIADVIIYSGDLRMYNSNNNELKISGSEVCGYAPQFPELFAGLKLRESLLVDNIDERIASILNVQDFLERNIIVDGENSELSGGQLKRLGLLRCLSIDRPVLLFDEPTSGLDESNSEIVWNVLSEKAENSLVIITSHEIPKKLSENNYVIHKI